jgi:hypothetical protein
MNPLTNKHRIGISREPEGQADRNKPGKDRFGRSKKSDKTWSEVKRLAGNRVRWRCYINALYS